MHSATLSDATISFDGKTLIANTGRMSRTWQWTGHGFRTTGVASSEGAVWENDDVDYDSDWLLPVCEDHNPVGELRSFAAEVSDDEGFTSEHVAFTAEIEYPEACLCVRFSVWAWPGGPGVRVHLDLKALEGFAWEKALDQTETSDASLRAARLQRACHRQECLPLDFTGSQRSFFGYFCDTQNRNDSFLDLLLEGTDSRELTHSSVSEWSNAVCVETDTAAVALLKESHKCVNQRGHDTGTFVCLPGKGIENHGWGIVPTEITREWQSAWASWCLVYTPGPRARQTAFKTFDKLRYPMTERDMVVQANTWGSSQGHRQHREAAAEASVLQEIDACADIGIDILQIDDGWQGDQYGHWFPTEERYPEGWGPVREHAARQGIELGLWMAVSTPFTVEDLTRNARGGAFRSFKLDFAQLQNRAMIDELMGKVRAFVLEMNHEVRVNWDLTEVCRRYGYYFAREFGCIYLENRKPVVPKSTTYRPATVLRDLWQISKYCNLLKFQGSVQNIDRVNPDYSDASAYTHDYCLAITLLSSPLYFCEMKFFSEAARSQIRPLLTAYKTVRADIVRGMTYPIGCKPDGAQWTGFECVLESGDGLFMLFREPWNQDGQGAFELPHLANKTLALVDLITGERSEASVDAAGSISFTMPPGRYRFLQYTTS